MNAFDQYTKYTLGNGIQTQKTYDDFGLLTKAKAGAVQELQQFWNNSSGNLNARVDWIKSRIETFPHDNLNRLTSYQVIGQTALTVDYANNGNIISKTDVGTYTYDPNKPHAVQSVTDPLGLMPLTQNITYTPFKRPAIVTEGDYELTFTYGPDQQRKKSLLTNLNSGVVEKTITYSGGYEKIETPTDVYEVHYINAGPALAINVKQNNGSDQLFYAYRDHLGSILTLTDATGNVVYEQNFDPWGRERNPNTWDYTPNPNTKPPWLIRGFTGHEHIDEVALINMNARMYDPIVARMLSPDNFVQDATYTQTYNRYSYAVNNPMVFTDPDGEFIWFVAAGAALGYYLGSSAYMGNYNVFSGDWWQGQKEGAWKAGVVGGIIGAGAGAVLAAGVGAAGTGLGAGFSATQAGVTSTAWNIFSNALVTANINIASAYVQGRGLEGAWKAGVVGLGAGIIGGTVASGVERAIYRPMMSNTIKLQNYVTAGLSGVGDRLVYGYDQGKQGWELAQYGLLGLGEGLLTANLGNKLLNVGDLGTVNRVAGRYLSSFATQAVTSIPGAGLTAYSYYITGAAAVGGYNQYGIGTGLLGGYGFLAATSAIYRIIVPEDYPARPYLQPYGPFRRR